MKKMHFPVIIEQDEDGVFIVSCPTIKGCHSYGKTVDEAMENIHEAIEACIDDYQLAVSDNRFIGFREIELSTAI